MIDEIGDERLIEYRNSKSSDVMIVNKPSLHSIILSSQNLDQITSP